MIVLGVYGGYGSSAASQSLQVLTPPITFARTQDSLRPTLPIEAQVNLWLDDIRTKNQLVSVTTVDKAQYPKDSLLALATRRAQAWIATLRTAPALTQGTQLDPYASVAVQAKEDPMAQQAIVKRLATPNLALAERALTLQHAVENLTSVDYPERLPAAERYLTQLDALGADAALWRFLARLPLLSTYFRLGKSADVTRVGMSAFDLIARIPFELRENTALNPGLSNFYAAVVDATSGQPNGAANIKALNARLLAATTVPSELLAQDSTFLYQAERMRGTVQSLVALSERVGQPGKPLVAQYWVNRGPSRDSQTVAVNDGKIRVIEVGSRTCGPCMAAIPGLERLHRRYPEVEFVLLTFGLGTWGNRVVPPKEEAEYMADHFTKNLRATFPIGIALATWVPNPEDDGQEAIVTTPTWQADQYPEPATPTFYILDGSGTIRRVMGGYDRELEETLASILEFLQRERSSS